MQELLKNPYPLEGVMGVLGRLNPMTTSIIAPL
jgi:hypothetical protein